MADRRGPRPWFGCDTYGEAWRAYCEAWSHVFENKGSRARYMIKDRRGEQALADLDHNMGVVKLEYAGDIENRTEIPKLLRL